jgi:hypothetical protein
VKAALLALALAALPDERAERHFDRMKIDAPDLSDDVSRRVVVYVLQKEHWVGAFTDLADRFTRFPDDLDLTVDFKLDAGEVARTWATDNEWKISFNLKKLCELQKRLDELEKMKREGKRFVFKIPPLKMDRLVYHEVTHILQGRFEAPSWFSEGMAQLVGDDLNAICQFVKDNKPVRGLDRVITDRNEIYARGHLFWKWLDSRGATSKTFELAFVKRIPWQQAVEEATNRSWVNVVAEESEWSSRELQRIQETTK